MPPRISRRSFLGVGVAAAAAAGAFSWIYRARNSWGEAVGLVADPQGIIDLPPDFSYQVLQRVGDAMSDGFNAPSAPDGMACFPGEEDTWVIMRNHEIHEGIPVDTRLAAAPNRGGGVSRLVIDRASRELGIPMVYGGLYRFEGQVAVLNHHGSPGYRDLFPEPPASGEACAEAGILGMLPGIIGNIQALEAVKLIAGIEPTLAGRLLIYDGLSHNTTIMDISTKE